MSISDFVSTKPRASAMPAMDSAYGPIFERLFAAWIGAFAALLFLSALALAVVQLIDWVQVAYIYAAITAITIVLAGLVYASRSEA